MRYNADGISPKLRRIDTGKNKNNNSNNKKRQIKLQVEKCVAQSKQGSFFLEHPFSILLRDKLYCLVTIKLIRHDKLSQFVEEMNMPGTTDLFLVGWVQNLPTSPNLPPTGIVVFWFAVLWLFMNREFLS